MGTHAEWEEWAMVNSEGFTFDLSTGVYLNGNVQLYSDGGHFDSISIYRGGCLEGEFAVFHANGTQSKSIQYKAGKKHGKETWWHENGYKSYSANHLDGQFHGMTYKWDDRGYLISTIEFDMGKPLLLTGELSGPAR